LIRVAAAKLTGLLIGAVQWFPTVDALKHSVRGTADAQFFNNGSLHPLNLVQLVAPYLFEKRVVGQNTHELGLYIGAVPCLLVAWLLLTESPARRQKRVFTFCCLLVPVALLLAMGSYAYLNQVQTWLPVVGSFRFPCRTIVLFHLAMAVLAAIALDRVVRRQRTLGDKTSDPVHSQWCIVVASIVIAAAAPLVWWSHVASWPLVIAGPILLVAAAWLLQRAQCGARWAPLALVALTAIDQGLYGLSYAALSRTETLAKFAQDSEIQPAGPAGARVALDADSALRDGTRHGNQLLLAGWSRVGGYLGLPPQRVLDYRGTNAIRVAGAWWVNNAQLEDARSISFARVNQPVAHARLVNRAIRSTSPGKDLEKIDVDRAALVDFPLELPSGQPGEVHPLAKSPGRLSLVAVAPSRQLLVVAESFHEGWQAFIDGQPANVWRVNGDYMGCEVPAGQHHVELLFLPASLKKGVTFTWCGLSLMLCGFLATCRGNGRGAASMGHGECRARGESRNES
ncbi:MAG: YfhO family protein, partial [Planctomycetota bacterium]|nr:YfhO family protein [Planctomycetota bacterium]